jgi:IS30 family transposase
MPKGTAISTYSTAYVQQVQNFINDYPRAKFNGENSTKRFTKELEKLNIQKILPILQITT